MNKAKKATGITAWPKDDRPRERLLKNGAATLKDAELIAIILRVGVQGMSAVEMGQALIQKFGSLKMMTEATADALGEIKGIKNAKIAQLLAVMKSPDERVPKAPLNANALAARRMQKNILGNGCVHCRKSIFACCI